MTNEQFNLLLQLTGIRADGMISACRSVLVAGLKQREAAQLHAVHEGKLSVRLGVLRETEQTVKQLAKFYPQDQ